MIHVIPLNDWFEHATLPTDTTCLCGATLTTDLPELLLVHEAFDGDYDTRKWAVVPVGEVQGV